MDSTIIQLITVQWTKQSRGGEQATMRNSVLDSFPLEVSELPDSIYIQKVEYSEVNSFKNPNVKPLKSINEEQLRENRLLFHEIDETLGIQFYGSRQFEKGARQPQMIGELFPNSWLRIIGNGRGPMEDTWGYDKYVYNIFYGTPSRFKSVVQSTEPKIIKNFEADLW